MKTTMKILSIGIVLMILITGCKKNQSSSPTEQKSPLDKQKIESVVKYCTSRVLSKVKSTDSIPVDSLRFYLEATSNYTYGIASAQGELQETDSNFFKLPFINDKIAVSDVGAVYSAMMDSIRVSYRKIQNTNKNLLVTLIKVVNLQDNKATIRVTSVILYGNRPQLGLFDTTDYWLWWNQGGNYGGKCDPYSGQTDLDAAIKIQQHVMMRKGISTGYYVSPTEIIIEPSHYPNSNHVGSDCYFKYYLFDNRDDLTCFHVCLMPFEMNWYLFGAEHICYTSDQAVPDPGARPDGYNFMSLFLTGDIALGVDPDYIDVYVIRGNVKYGILMPGGGQQTL